ncbi:MAG: HAMP domain-containing histidine kinase [Burkholderiales bacterium]|nr:MAG: HAMP domain-containing histidine kinase [Burkholderiales bacterium]
MAANLDANSAIIEFRASRVPQAIAFMQRALPLLKEGAQDPYTTCSNLTAWASQLIRVSHVRTALDLLETCRSRSNLPVTTELYLSRLYLEAYAALGTADAFEKGEREVRKIDAALLDEATWQIVHVRVLEHISLFYESFGRYEAALKARKRYNALTAERQRLANEKTRVETLEKLDVALKDQENTRLKAEAEAEVQAERQRGWIVGFAAVAVGALLAAAALVVAVRRGRRLAKVSAELEARNGELEQRSASRIRLLAAACHDLRQPAHALGMLAELGSDATEDPTRYLHCLQSVRRSAASLGDMLDELMDLGRLDGGHYTPHLSDISLGELLQEAMLHFGPLAKRKGLTLEAPPVDILIVSDRHLLRRMLFNVVSNAIKYTDTGSVRVDVERVDGEVRLRVQDTGPGIPQDKLDDVFRDYVRLNPLKAAEGLGIGLSIVRRSAELLAHPLTLTSSPDEGTTITLTLPISQSESATSSGDATAEVAAARVAYWPSWKMTSTCAKPWLRCCDVGATPCSPGSAPTPCWTNCRRHAPSQT